MERIKAFLWGFAGLIGGAVVFWGAVFAFLACCLYVK